MTGVQKQPGVPDSMHARSGLSQDNGNQWSCHRDAVCTEALLEGKSCIFLVYTTVDCLMQALWKCSVMEYNEFEEMPKMD
jgi:hypothetical protein